MQPIPELVVSYIKTLKTTSWAANELYKLDWSVSLHSELNWTNSDEEICDFLLELLTRRFGGESVAGINFLMANRRFGQPLMTTAIVSQLRCCADQEIVDLVWDLPKISYPALSCYVASMFPDRIYPIHNTNFGPLFEYLFAEEFRLNAKNGARHVAEMQPWLQRVAELLTEADVAKVFLENANRLLACDSVRSIDLQTNVDPTLERLVLNWVVQDFCFYALLHIGATQTKGIPAECIELHPSQAEEGQRQLKVHYRLERNSRIAQEAKRLASITNKNLPCECCENSFALQYGEKGVGYIEAHHLIPLGERKMSSTTHVDDFAMLCSNCHAMVHRSTPAMKLDELRTLLKQAHQKDQSLPDAA